MSRNHNEVRIRGVGNALKKEVENISKNLGISVSQLLKPVLRTFVDGQPEKLKREYQE